MGPFPLSRSASPSTILTHLLSHPMPSLQHSREVILEYVLGREIKLREKKAGRGGKGTLGREGLEDISKRLGEVEDGLKVGTSTTPRGPTVRESRSMPQSPMEHEPDGPRQTGLALILSLRMSLSYFSLQELANQLLLLAIADAERVILQHIRRRLPGEGRWGVGNELEYVEGLVSTLRLANEEIMLICRR